MKPRSSEVERTKINHDVFASWFRVWNFLVFFRKFFEKFCVETFAFLGILRETESMNYAFIDMLSFSLLKYRSHRGIISFGTMIIKTSIKSALPTPCIPVHVRPPERILIFPLRARSVGSPRVHAPPGMCNCAVPAPLYAGHVPRRVRVMPGASSSLMSSSAVDVIWTNSCEPIIRFLVCKRPSCALNLRYFGNQVYPDCV